MELTAERDPTTASGKSVGAHKAALALDRWKRRVSKAGSISSRTVAVVVLGPVAVSAAIIFAATQVADSSANQLAMNRIDSNMRVAWHLLHDLGRNARIVDKKLLVGNTVINDNPLLVSELRDTVGGVATVFQGDERITTTVKDASGRLGLGTHLAPGAARTQVLDNHRKFRGVVDVLGTQYFSGYDPILDERGTEIGALYVGIKKSDLLGAVTRARLVTVAASAGCIVLIAILFLAVGRHLARQIDLRERSLQDTNKQLALALDNMAMGLCHWSEMKTLLVVNRRLADILDLPYDELRPGTPFREFIGLCLKAGTYVGRDLDAVYGEYVAMINLRQPTSTLVPQANGRVVSLAYRPVHDGGWLMTYEDVTEHEKAEATLSFMARHDALTELPNRVLLKERLDEAMARDSGAAILCLDLDRFKEVNDTLGHPAGDALLKETATRLLSCVRATDTVARLGGDEFAVVLSPLGQPEDAFTIAERILETIRQPFDISGEQVDVGISVGIDLSVAGGRTPDTMLKQADLALYRAKTEGGGMYRLFEPEMHKHLQARRMLESELRRALAEEEFELFYQPLVDVRSRRVSGFEALVRWRHPTRGVVGAGDIVPIAEATGLIVPIGAWVLHRACADAALWPPSVKVAVNLSPVQFRYPRLMQTIQSALDLAKLPASRLELEITESVVLRDSEATVRMLHELRSLGVHIALDDFGTGYSSLSYVRNFPFDKIKIDRSFVDGVGIRPDCDAIVHAVTGIARSLGIRSLAEGVETEEQFRWLLDAGCDEVQGFLFSAPRPAADVPDILAAMDSAKSTRQ